MEDQRYVLKYITNLKIADTIYNVVNVKLAINEIAEYDFIQSDIQYEQSRVKLAGDRVKRRKALRCNNIINGQYNTIPLVKLKLRNAEL